MRQAANPPSISPQELHRRWQDGAPVEIIDVRSSLDFAAAHVPTARWVAFDHLDPGELMAARQRPEEDPLYVICQIGRRSADVCARFLRAGFTNVVNVEGGTGAWQRAGFPVVCRTHAFSLQRQDQVVAGIIVLTGWALGISVHPVFTLISATAGAGLIYAGVTGTHVLGMILARMPWNRGPGVDTEAVAELLGHDQRSSQEGTSRGA